MNRRNALKAMAAVSAAPAIAAPAAQPIQLHVDMDVDPAKEKEMVSNYRKIFRPTITKQPGFVRVQLLKLREAAKGPVPINANYRLIISFQTEEQRKAWVATDEHKKVWPTIENTLRGEKFTALLYDPA